MKYIFYILCTFVLALASCSKLSDCAAVDAKCLDVPPTNEACQTVFSKWFYDGATNTCELKVYSGCKAYGFDKEEECNACKCKK